MKRYVSFEKWGLGIVLGIVLDVVIGRGILPQKGKNGYIKAVFS